MIGNVSEWVADFYKEDYYKYSPDVDPPGPERGSAYVDRGGSILTIPNDVGVSHRGQATDARYTSPEIGFRCAGGTSAP
jgi:formylglycine-generating enzyme